jgi:phosphate transport system permease protein
MSLNANSINPLDMHPSPSESTANMHSQASFNQGIYASRKRTNLIGLTLSMAAMAIGLVFLLWILSILFYKGFASFSLDMILNKTPGPDTEGGGLGNAILGSMMIVLSCTLISTPIGVLAGIYLSEYGKTSAFSGVTRFLNDIMLSAPSIVIGLFVYALVVVNAKHFSGWAGTLALTLIAIPVVVRTTENMLSLVPVSLREAAFALGAPKWKVSLSVVLKAARSGVMTGILLALARVSGETAPLLFTALNNPFFSTNMNAPMANLPVVIFQFAMSPYQNWVDLAWGGALLITLAVLGLNILARVYFREKVAN